MEKLRNLLELLNVRRNLVLIGVLGIGILLRLLQPHTLLLDPDSTGYASPALNFLLQGQPDHVYGRSYVYPLFLLGIWTIFKNLFVVALVQMTIALGSLVLFYHSMDEWLETKLDKGLLPIARTMLLLLILLMAWDGNIYLYEHCLRPEGLGMASLLVLISGLLKYDLAESPGLKWVIAWLLIVFLVLLALLHPRFMLSFGCIGLVLAREIWKEKHLGWYRLVFFVLSLIVSVLVVYPEIYLSRKFDTVGRSFAMRQLVYSQVPSVLDLVEQGDWVEADFDTTVFKRDMRLVLQEKGGGSAYYKALGYNLDKLQYELSGKDLYAYFNSKCARLSQGKMDSISSKELAAKSDSAYNNYFYGWATKLVVQRPWSLAKKMVRESVYAMLITYQNFLGFPFHLKYEQSFESSRVEQEILLQNMGYKPGQLVVLNRPWVMDAFFLLICIPLQVLFLISLIYLGLAVWKGQLPWWGSSIFGAILLYYLSVGFLHTLGFPRYMHSLSPLMYVSVFLACILTLQKKVTKDNS